MNYKKLYDAIILRSKTANRVKTKEHYFEKHHIIPEFMFVSSKRNCTIGDLDGNPDDPDNIVLLTPREHFICHVLLYKIYKGTKYGYRMGSALQFFYVKVMGQHARSEHQFIKDSQWYARCRDIGRASISAARKGKMPVVDAITREKIGSMAIDHPRVLSGEWVHHSKGAVLTAEVRKGKACRGTANGRYSGKTDSEIFEYAKKYVDEHRYFEKKEFEILCLQNGYPTMRGKGKDSFRFVLYGGGITGLIRMLELHYGELITWKTNFTEYFKRKKLYNDKNNTN